MYFNSYEEHVQMINGQKQMKIMEVKVKNGKGVKKVTMKQGGHKAVHEENLGPEEITNVLERKFVPGLFNGCNEGCMKKLGGLGSPSVPLRGLGSPKRGMRSKSHRTRRHKK
jgi:hypothetical protein